MLIDIIADDLNINENFISNVAKRSNWYYRTYKIPKRNGGTRPIHHPSPVLKTFQYWLVHRIFNYLPISDYATAYAKGCSIAKNAAFHLNSSNILHLDICNFFPSIKTNHLNKMLEKNKKLIKEQLGIDLNQDDKKLINDLTMYQKALTIGSVSSPILSNLVMYDVDLKIAEVANKYKCRYTRYADDMVLSSNSYISSEVIDEIDLILVAEEFNLNKDKVYFMSSKDRMVVTGVNVNSDRLTVGRKKRDDIKKMVYLKCEKGLGDNYKILGNLCYLKDIDPWYYNKIIIKYPKILELLKNN